ncbi:very long-chain acyl-CoA synthetase-like [Lacerta agilis]|uniref:very long-chain acyl-CoA synthetase-like n=1 Tax=Lacerta agilis TaxID=80427 RepID=UPI00141A374C|nr:very long-chain acyl-CoA synthetase-like [Lacerta agilis]
MLDVNTVVSGILILVYHLGKFYSPYFWQDVVSFFRVLQTGYKCHRCLSRKPPITLLDFFLAKVQKHPEKPLVLFGDETYSYRDIDRRSSQLARVLRDHVGLKEGETVAVFLKNVPAYLWVWMGLEKIGSVMACINYNIRAKSLLHVLSSCKAKVLLTTPDFKDAIEDVLPALKNEGVQVFFLSEDSPTEGVEALLGQIQSSSAEPVPISFRANVTAESTSLYIFTSGTTGLPKAALLSQRKLLIASNLPSHLGARPVDVVYITLPLYHTVGLIVGVGGCLEAGSTCVLRHKFSVSEFWNDCRRYRISLILYVGEMMRYLCNVKKTDSDRDHCVRMAIGNGMRAEVWKEFLHRFGPIQIHEMYGATEGNVGFFNYTGKVGAVGRSHFLYKKLAKYEFIKYDVDKDEPVRDKNGHCIPVIPGETGLFVAKITGIAPFSGYAGDQQKSEKKILRDVFTKGDCYFNSGDLLMEDQEGFVYFKDRVGDTFRWKGENVATTEVENTLAPLKFIQEVNVYGVPVPGHEGKTGMAAICLKKGHSFDGQKLYAHANDLLPAYAVPRFVRIQGALEITGTFKQVKSHLVKEGFDPAVISDPLFFLDDSEECYMPLTPQIFSTIAERKLKL